MNEEGADKDLSSKGPVVSTRDLVRDLLNSLLEEVVGNSGERRRKDEAKPAFSEEQRLAGISICHFPVFFRTTKN